MPCSVGFWQSCSGCYETEDGYPVGDYPIHPKHYVPVGGGCRECKGKGIVFHPWTKADAEGFREFAIEVLKSK